MSSQSSQIATRLGLWSALLASVCAISYDLGQIVEWLGWMGSGGGPEHNSTWYGLVVLLVPSLFLGISFVVLMVCVNRQTPADGRVWSQLGLVFAAMYGTLICMNYYVQLTFVAPRLYRGDLGPTAAPFVFNVFDSFTYSVDLLGYSFMSIATLFVSFAFPGDGPEKVARRFCPNILPYEVGTAAAFGFAEWNGRSLTDNAPNIMFSIAANAPISLGIGKESVTSKPSKIFPYVPAAK